jgi:thioredoxin 1
MSSDEIRAGSKEMMTHAQRQAFLKTSSVGKLFGVADLLPEVAEAMETNHTPATKAKAETTLSGSEKIFIQVNESSFTQEVLESDIPILVCFTAPWSGLCRIMWPLVVQFKSKCSAKIKVVEINADENFNLSNYYQLKSVPTFLLLENGCVRHRLEGFRGREDLRLALEEIKITYTSRQNTCTDSQAHTDVAS